MKRARSVRLTRTCTHAVPVYFQHRSSRLRGRQLDLELDLDRDLDRPARAPWRTRDNSRRRRRRPLAPTV